MIISDVLPVMVDDALVSSHPIIVDVSSPAEITSVFDAISYSKVKTFRDFLKDYDACTFLLVVCQTCWQHYRGLCNI